MRYSYPQKGVYRAIVPIPEDVQLSPGERVYVNLRHCNLPIARVMQPK